MKKLIEILKQVENKPAKTNAIPQIICLIEDIEDERIKKIIVPKLEVIEKEIKELLIAIKKCKTVQEAQDYFDLLQKLQEALASLFFKQKIIVSQGLEKFITDFDRIDDDWLRNYMFSAIKKNEYTL